MNPAHKQKKSKDEDAPQWYIDAYLESLVTGTAIVAIRNNGEHEHIPVARYLELLEGLTHKIETLNKNNG